MTTDTPRTDATEGSDGTVEVCAPLCELARQLERELTEARDQRDTAINSNAKLRAEREAHCVELAEAKALAEHNITTKAEIDRVWGAQILELRTELAEARAKELTLKDFVKLSVDETDRLRAQLKELQTHKSALIQDVNNLERALRDANEDKAIVDWLEAEDVDVGGGADHPFYARIRRVGALLYDGAESVRAAFRAAMHGKS